MRHSAAQITYLEPLQLKPAQSSCARSARSSLGSDGFIANLDRVQVLGDGRSGRGEQAIHGHDGCVNACAWNETGDLLATGSDDFRICCWQMGLNANAQDLSNDISGLWPRLGMDLKTTIHTGHTRNIFSVKWAPYCSSSRLISCAGDHKVKVFDVSRQTSAIPVSNGAKHWQEFSPDSACVATFRCHRDRVKRISLEDSPDVFLTCSEDGTVRQHDLRTGHTCGRQSCPDPLADYTHQRVSLYTLTSSRLRPELFVCAGTSPVAYLHDRRMVSRTTLQQWGVPMVNGKLTQCVRQFGLPESDPDTHIVACKMSEQHSAELLCSFGGGAVALFDIDASPDVGRDVVAPNKKVKLQETIGDTEDVEDNDSVDGSDAMDTDTDSDEARPSLLPTIFPSQTYIGHRNVETVKDVNFGFGDQKVMSGSDCGRCFIWNKQSGEIENILEGDGSVVNVMTTHPRLPVLALSGIDSTVKIFAPTSDGPKRFSALADKERIVNQNASRRGRSQFVVPSTAAIMTLLASRMRPGADGQSTLQINSEDIDAMIAEGNDECVIA